jgi:hypothetical protein
MAFVNQVFNSKTAQVVPLPWFPNGIDRLGNGVLSKDSNEPRNHNLLYI